MVSKSSYNFINNQQNEIKNLKFRELNTVEDLKKMGNFGT